MTSESIKYEQEHQRLQQYLVQEISLEDDISVYRLRSLIFIISAAVLGIGIWSYFANIPEVANALGEIVPDGRVYKVQHIDGGVVSEIHVKEGDRISEGDSLVTINTEILQTELNSLLTSEQDYRLRLERLSALLNERNPVFDVEVTHKVIAKAQQSLYQEQLRAQTMRELAIQQKILNRKKELESKQTQYQAIEKELGIYQEQFAMQNQLLASDLVSKVSVLDTSARLASANNRLAQVQGELEQLANTIYELSDSLLDYQSTRRETWLTEQTDVTSQLAIIKEQIQNIKARIARAVITANTSGIIKGLTINSINTVINPSETIMEIVPVGKELLAEAKLKPSDVGRIAIGMPVDIKVSSFDSQRFGSIPGTVKDISATTFIGPDNATYYRVNILLAKSYVGRQPELNNIIPGMTIQADIITGEKTILEYLMAPLQRGMDGAFTEH